MHYRFLVWPRGEFVKFHRSSGTHLLHIDVLTLPDCLAGTMTDGSMQMRLGKARLTFPPCVLRPSQSWINFISVPGLSTAPWHGVPQLHQHINISDSYLNFPLSRSVPLTLRWKAADWIERVCRVIYSGVYASVKFYETSSSSSTLLWVRTLVGFLACCFMYWFQLERFIPPVLSHRTHHICVI